MNSLLPQVLPESARWLVANGKVDAAHRYLMQCAETNNRTKSMETVTPNVNFCLLYPLVNIEKLC